MPEMPFSLPTPFTSLVLREGATPVALSRSFSLGPSQLPTLITLVSTAVVQNVWGFHYPSPGHYRRGWQCRVQALAQGTPGSLPLPFSYLDPSAAIQGGSQGPDHRSGPLFLKLVGWVSLGLGIQYSPMSQGGATAHWHLGIQHSISSLWQGKPSWQWQDGEQWWVTSLPGNNNLNEFYVLFMVTNIGFIGLFY